ncbi:MAG: hypothetical protein GY854_02900 [Deltaproteobacteria bacterium]|nr:hypothetical protein [Deltaproteobacteria bacterium]
MTNKQMEEVDLRPNPFHGDWNYSIHPTDTENS